MSDETFDSSIARRLISLPRRGKQAVVILATFWPRGSAFGLPSLCVWNLALAHSSQLWIYVAAPAIFFPVFIRFGLYRAIFRYTGLATMQTLLKAALDLWRAAARACPVDLSRRSAAVGWCVAADPVSCAGQ